MERKKTFLRLSAGWQFVWGFLFIVLTYIVNLFMHGNTNFSHSLAVGSCQIGMFYGYCYFIRMSFDRGRRRFAGIIILLFSLVLPLTAPILVYTIFPLLGVKLQNPNLAFNPMEFSAKVLMALKTVWLGAVLYYVFYRKEVMGRRVTELEYETSRREKELVEMKNDLLMNAGQSHYARHVMTDVVARAVATGDTYTAEQVTHIGKTFDYVADIVHQQIPVAPIQKALTYFNQVVASIRLRRGGKQVIHLTMEGEPTMQTIGPLTLTTILENSDTHGWVDLEHPIHVHFLFSRGKLEFTCINSKPRMGSKVKSSGKGLSLVKQELALLNRHHTTLDVQENEETYTTYLTINYH